MAARGDRAMLRAVAEEDLLAAQAMGLIVTEGVLLGVASTP